jgi:hypothetical protein
MAVGAFLGAVSRPALAGGLKLTQRLFPKSSGIAKPGFATRMGAGIQEGAQRFAGTRTGQLLDRAGVAPVQRWAQQGAARTPAAHLARAQAVGVLPRAASYAGYAAPGLALTEVARRGYDYARDRRLPEISDIISAPPSRDARMQEMLDLYQQSIIDPQLEALDQFVGGDWEAGRRERAEELISQMEELGASRALGVQDAYGEFGSEQAARAAAIDRLAGLQGQVSSADVAEGQAAMEDAIYDDSLGGELEGLVPVSGALADAPEDFATMEDIAAREALRDILASGIESRVDAGGADRWGDLQARDIRADFGIQAFGARQNLEAAIAAERERREEMRMLRGLELESGRGGFEFDLERTRMAERIEEDEAVRALLSSPTEVRRLQRLWRDLTDPALWRVGPLGDQAQRQLALYQSMGISDFDDFIRAAATGKIVV